MKVVFPEPAIPTQTMATGGFCSVVEDAMLVVVVKVLFELLLSSTRVSTR